MRMTLQFFLLLTASTALSQPVVSTYRLIGNRLYDFRPVILAGTNHNPYYIYGRALGPKNGDALPVRRLSGTRLEVDGSGLSREFMLGSTGDQLKVLAVGEMLHRKKPLSAGELLALDPDTRAMYLSALRPVYETEDILLLHYPLAAVRGTEVRAFAIRYAKTNAFDVWDFGTTAPNDVLTNFTEVVRVYTNGPKLEKLTPLRPEPKVQ